MTYLEALFASMTRQLTQLIPPHEQENVFMVGIHTGGVWVAEQLHRRLQLPLPLGRLNIAFYRDDFTRIGLHPHVTDASYLPVEIENRHIILVDDVLYSGRTVRAAHNELFDYGRPASIKLAVLIERPGRELPIQADVVGVSLALTANQHIKLTGPDPLSLDILTFD
ncbi:bifunctional pyr operon transcriptional regulator/uracil phosphoribosyltransferase PyrR [Thioflexithrix psekupsensis]|uniref:Bifunctional pyr operon transcriptional regulator/uracil phosphoribosyltransferase n=1 Tax=Thioflexithrix psekupsensis TaxID=1570016 RepID=A0A251X6G5_9GAMM|nr:bifunctional pyr operon transcriptional regulator/uracil phosphoribosyltransferase PyrR [Thioflexithrix psekupsensis]OUD13228.1 bifunctional pyr operon transcriptional regulator/uracil phosphoribosyltransferase [Thioflexithrix psekupsensis]